MHLLFDAPWGMAIEIRVAVNFAIAASLYLMLSSAFLRRAREHLARIPYVALDPKETATVRHAAVAFTTATYGINTAGTVYRMDDVPIPLRPAFESPYPSDEEVLRRIERRIRELQGAGPGEAGSREPSR